MEKITEIIGENISSLRKANNLTQQQLADKINYSNKAVSRWENGECLPSVETLSELCEFFGVDFEYIIKRHTEPVKAQKLRTNVNKFAILLLTCLIIYAVSTVVFVYINIFYDISYWPAFVWGAPVCAFAIFSMSRRWWKGLVPVVSISVFIWTLIASLYCTFLSYNVWLIFIIGIPIQIIIILVYFINKDRKG